MLLEDNLKIIRRGTLNIISEEELVLKLKENRPLNIKFGIDPTAPDIHLGHTVPLQKLKQFQDEGHNIQLVIGDYTAMIGDPSGRSETRPMLTREQIGLNLQTYTTQVFKILDQSKTTIYFNSEWLGKFSGEDMIKLSSKYTVQQLLQRRDFSNRMKENRPISVSELMYPLLVGYDSVHLKSDIELGGSDQLFNFMASRSMQSAHNQTSEVVLILPLLEGIDGEKKMSKSYGNAIGVTENPTDMYGKIMSIGDNLMMKYFELISDASLSELEKIKDAVINGTENPMLYKKKLAKEIVARYHGAELADYVELDFARVHQRKDVPEDIEKLEINYESNKGLFLIDLIKLSGRANSGGEVRRLIDGKGVKLNGEIIEDPFYKISPHDGQILQIGKRYFKELYFNK
ncbi:MAG: tyrosine--tRNA ligase [Candidatus Nanoarchaeia archaeon]